MTGNYFTSRTSYVEEWCTTLARLLDEWQTGPELTYTTLINYRTCAMTSIFPIDKIDTVWQLIEEVLGWDAQDVEEWPGHSSEDLTSQLAKAGYTRTFRTILVEPVMPSPPRVVFLNHTRRAYAGTVSDVFGESYLELLRDDCYGPQWNSTDNVETVRCWDLGDVDTMGYRVDFV